MFSEYLIIMSQSENKGVVVLFPIRVLDRFKLKIIYFCLSERVMAKMNIKRSRDSSERYFMNDVSKFPTQPFIGDTLSS